MEDTVSALDSRVKGTGLAAVADDEIHGEVAERGRMARPADQAGDLVAPADGLPGQPPAYEPARPRDKAFHAVMITERKGG
jgi:hypothetical protein